MDRFFAILILKTEGLTSPNKFKKLNLSQNHIKKNKLFRNIFRITRFCKSMII